MRGPELEFVWEANYLADELVGAEKAPKQNVSKNTSNSGGDNEEAVDGATTTNSSTDSSFTRVSDREHC